MKRICSASLTAPRRGLAGARALVAIFVIAAITGALLPMTAAAAAAPSSLESNLFSLLNQSRQAQGLAALRLDSTLSAIARGAPIHTCGGTTAYRGRSRDMVERSYFSHQNPSCGAYVWPALTEYSIGYTTAAENIGWNTYPSDQSPGQVNSAFMNSPEHRDNMLGAYDEVGIGAWVASSPWRYNGASYSGVIMYTEIFVRSSAATVRAATHTPAPASPRRPAAVRKPSGALLTAAPPAPGAPTKPIGAATHLSHEAAFEALQPTASETSASRLAGFDGAPGDSGLTRLLLAAMLLAVALTAFRQVTRVRLLAR